MIIKNLGSSSPSFTRLLIKFNQINFNFIPPEISFREYSVEKLQSDHFSKINQTTLKSGIKGGMLISGRRGWKNYYKLTSGVGRGGGDALNVKYLMKNL